MTEESLFEQARWLPLEQWAPFLERECPDEALRQRVLALLAAAAVSNSPLDTVPRPLAGPEPVPLVSTDVRSTTEVAGTTIAGRYKLLQQIGEGGMGTVWMAEQTEPVRRKVAVKLIRAERGQSKTILARFEAERQAIALMDHPHIARLLDAGTTESGAPFFVMELVKGIPLNDFCDQHRLTVPERLHLFMQICGAVQHAHQKGIIHRDLKPSNILVESHDGKAVPKVIDFGLAKATTGLQLTEQSLFTGFGTVLGTPIYMAPEQATFNAIDIDTRADIYTLGVILYELLTGTTPITRETFKKAALDEVLRLVREQEPVTPSSRVSNSEAAPSVAASRQTEPAKLGRFVRGELDWVVMKALAKERERRYETANGFARDIERFLNHEPVQAGPPTAWYRLQKFVQRNRPQVIAAGFVLAALVVGVIGTTLGLLEARRQEGLALAAAEEERQAKLREAERAEGERKAKLEAERNLAFAKKGNELLSSVFTGLDPKTIAESGRPLQDVLKDNLKKAVAELEGSAIGDPMEVAAMQTRLGVSLVGLGEARLAVDVLIKARETFRAKRGLDHPDTLTSMSNLASGYWAAAQPDKALPLMEETFTLTKTKLGPDHPLLVTCMNNLANGYGAIGQSGKAVQLYEEALKLTKARLGPDHPDTLRSMGNLASGYQDFGMQDKAVSLREETLRLQKAKLGPDHPDTLLTMSNLATSYRTAKKLDKALPLFEEVLKLTRTKLGPDHPLTLTVMNNLAVTYGDTGMRDRGLLLLEEALRLTRVKLGVDHPSTLLSMSNLASGYWDAAMRDKALPLMEETFTLTKARLGPDHSSTLAALSNLAEGYKDSGILDKALPRLEELFKLRKAKLGSDHPDTLITMNSLALGYKNANQLDKALPLWEETLKLRKAKLGPHHPDTLVSMHNLALGYAGFGKLDKALPLYEETLKQMKAKLGSDHPDTLSCMSNLASGYWSAGKRDQALPLWEETLKLRKAKLGPDHPDTLTVMNNLAEGYKDSGQPAKALPLLEELFKFRKAKLGLDHPEILIRMGNLAGVYKDAGQLDKALPLLEETLKRMKAKFGPDHLNTLSSMNNLALGYSAIGQSDKAVPLLEETLKLLSVKLGPDHPNTLGSMANLGMAYCDAKQGEKAAATLRAFVAGMKKKYPPGSPQFAGLLSRISLDLLKCDQFATAEEMLREALAIREKTEPDAWTTFNTQSLLGAALLGQKKYAEAEPLLLKGYEKMKAREKTIPPQAGTRIPEALDRLIELYRATKKPDEVKKYTNLRAKYPAPPKKG